MRTNHLLCCMLAVVMLAGISLISCGNSAKAKSESGATVAEGEDFDAFLKQFTASARFQYSRIKFPLRTPITLLTEDGDKEQEFPFTQEKWPLLDSSTLKEERIVEEEGGTYVSKFIVDNPKEKIFQAGYEESEIDWRIIFELQEDGKWYVVDGYTGWYGDISTDELKETIQHVQEENTAFKELHP